MALSANRQLKGKVDGRTRELIITNATVIYVGALVNIALSSGKAVVGADTASQVFGGIAITGGTGDSGGTVTCVVEIKGTRWVPHNGTAAQTDVGKLFCTVSDEKVDLISAVTNDVIVGRCVNVDTINNLVEIDLIDKSNANATPDSINAVGSVKSSSPTAGIGYSTGAGLAATQSTNKSTTVTNGDASTCGTITLNGAALAASTTVSFAFTNAAIAATDTMVLNHVSVGTPGSYTLNGRCGAGTATIDVRNVSLGSLSEAIVIQWSLIKAVAA